MKQSEWDNPKLFILCSEDKNGELYSYAWSKEEVPKKAVRRLVPKHPDDIKYFCLPWWRLYSSKQEAKKNLPCIWR